MTTPRRDFLGWIGMSTLVGATAPSILTASPLPTTGSPGVSAGAADWDMSWTRRITGKHKLVFDAPELEGGLPVVRANGVGAQYAEVFGDPMAQISRVLVLRHHAIDFAMNDAHWNRFKLGDASGITGPDGSGVTYNPVRAPNDAMPAPFRAMMLEPFQQSGGQVLACNLALQFLVVPRYVAAGMAADAAYAAAKADMLPGVILQPSGVFAVGVAQSAGCSFIPASAAE